MVDSYGVQGMFLCVSMMIALSAATALAFIYFWRKGRLNMDEDAKYQMMKEDEEK